MVGLQRRHHQNSRLGRMFMARLTGGLWHI
jgi:hypothetical protein